MEELKQYLKTNENGNTTFQNQWNTAKAFVTGKFIAIQDSLKKQKQEKSQISNLTLYLRELDKE